MLHFIMYTAINAEFCFYFHILLCETSCSFSSQKIMSLWSLFNDVKVGMHKNHSQQYHHIFSSYKTCSSTTFTMILGVIFSSSDNGSRGKCKIGNSLTLWATIIIQASEFWWISIALVFVCLLCTVTGNEEIAAVSQVENQNWWDTRTGFSCLNLFRLLNSIFVLDSHCFNSCFVIIMFICTTPHPQTMKTTRSH